MNYYLLRALGYGPHLLAWHVRRIDESRLDDRTDPERFSPREVIAHMADWEPILRGRMETGIKTPGATVMGMDEWERGQEVGYSKADIEASIATFIEERAKTIQLLENATPENWASKFTHSELGEISVYDYANTMACHDTYHMEQLSHY